MVLTEDKSYLRKTCNVAAGSHSLMGLFYLKCENLFYIVFYCESLVWHIVKNSAAVLFNCRLFLIAETVPQIIQLLGVSQG